LLTASVNIFSSSEALLSVEVRLKSDAVLAAALGQCFARQGGLSAPAIAEVPASELATKRVRHAGASGTVELWREDRWLFIRSRDCGPGMTDTERLCMGRGEGGGRQVVARRRSVLENRRRW
jgi:anti-sigma regulatory factor (Ser/Thr protein kinase)